jgi:transposase
MSFSINLKREEPSMEEISRIGMDTSKHVFQVHGVNGAGEVVLRRRFRRGEVARFFAGLHPVVVGMEACGGSHYWARVLGDLGHEVKLLAAQLVKPYVKRNKNDAADAEAICEAMGRASMRFVAVKTAEQQASLMLLGLRNRLVRERTRLGNRIRGYAGEFGYVASLGTSKIDALLARLEADEELPELAREMFAVLGRQYATNEVELGDLERRLKRWQRTNEPARRVAMIPGIGPVTSAHLVIKAPDPGAFASGRDFAAWLGLTPKDHSTAGRRRLGGITRAGDETLRSLLVLGATAVIQQVRRGKGPAWPWLHALVARKQPKLAAIALANKMARIAWKLLVSGQSFAPARLQGAVAKAS